MDLYESLRGCRVRVGKEVLDEAPQMCEDINDMRGMWEYRSVLLHL